MSRTKGKRFKEKTKKEKRSKHLDYDKNTKATRKKEKKKTSIISKIIIIICIIVIIFSLYNIICWFLENHNSNSLLSDIQSKTTITQEQIVVDGENINKRNYDFSELLQSNSQTVGWIYVPNTNIDYPVVQTNNNDYYLNHSFDNSTNSAGWVFADYRCNTYESSNVIIYGHNRKDKSMFGSLKNILNEEWRSNEENLYINFATPDGTHVYRIFSTFICNDSNVNSYLETSFSSEEDFNNYIQKTKNRSAYDFNTNLENTEKIITLYTCHGLNNQRLLVFAALVD